MLTEAAIFRGAFWSAVGAVFERAMFFLLPIFIAPLGPASLGIFYLSLRVFHGIVSFPTNALNIRYTGRLRQYIQDPKSLKFEETAAFLLKAYFIQGVVIGIFIFVLILVTAPVKSLAFLALAMPFAVTNSYMMRLLQLLQRFKKIFFIQAVFIFLFQMLYLTIFIKVLHMGIAAAFAGQFFMAVIISIISFVFIFDRLNLLGLFQKISLKAFALSKLSFANLLFITINPFLDLLIILALFGFSALGHYIVLLYLPLFIHRIPTTLFSMFFHVAAVKTRKNEDITEISKSVFKWILIITIPIFIIIMFYPSTILSVLFHKSYVKDLDITRLLAISFFLQSLSFLAERILVAKNKKAIRVISNYIFVFLFIVLSLIFGLSFGLFGIALAFLISSILDSLLKYTLAVKIAKVSFIGWDHIKILSAGTISALLSYMLFPKTPLLFFFFFFILYSVILWIAGVFSQKAVFHLRKMIAKEVTLGGGSNE